MKKILCAVFCGVLMVSMLAGCGNKTVSSVGSNSEKESNPAIGTATAEDLLGKQPAEGVLANINNEDITDEDLQSILPVLQYVYQKNVDDEDWDEFEDYAVQYLTSAKLYYLLIADNGISIDEEALEETFQSIINETGNPDDFYAEIEEFKISEDDVKEFLRAEQAYNLLYDFATKDVTVTDEEVEAYYNDNIEGFTDITSRDFYQVLFDNEDDAKAALESIKNGDKTFEDVVNETNTEDGGFIATVSAGDLMVPFEEPTWSLKENEVYGEVLSSDMGYHIIMANNFINNKTYTLDEVKDSIEKQVLTTNKETAMQTFVNDGVLKYGVSIY